MGESAESILDELYGLPLDEFTSARDAAAKRLRAGGDRSGAGAVKAAAKPVLSAWLVNQLFRREADLFDALLQAGRKLRISQNGAMRGDGLESLHQATEAQRAAISGLVEAAAEISSHDDQRATATVLERVAANLHAISARPSDDGPFQGRLVKDLPPPGFDALAGMLAGSTPVSPRAPRERPRATASAPQKHAQLQGALTEKSTSTAAPLPVRSGPDAANPISGRVGKSAGPAPPPDATARARAEKAREEATLRAEQSQLRARAFRDHDRALKEAARRLRSAEEIVARKQRLVEGALERVEKIRRQLAEDEAAFERLRADQSVAESEAQRLRKELDALRRKRPVGE